ncbi:MAG TPA: TolC family protein [Saprospiraceae bacterium]|nr:TolC family protein [Saprospiraceae bacterium]
MKWILIALILPVAGLSQGYKSILDSYIEMGILGSHQLKGLQWKTEKALYAVEEAKSANYPSVDFLTNYFLAGGGRTVDFPAGDLLNPVFSTLNQIVGSDEFPMLQNERILLNPHNFYDTRIRTSYPIYYPEIKHEKNIRNKQVEISKLLTEQAYHELARNIKVGYFQYLQGLESVKIYENALELAEENLRINTSLFKNDKINRTSLIRSENEIVKINSLLEVAKQKKYHAAAYFNFLIHRERDAPIEEDNFTEIPNTSYFNPEFLDHREELKQLRLSKDINNEVISIQKSLKLPRINAFLDLGSQGFDFEVSRNSFYYFFGIGVEWNLFNSNKNNHKIKQAQLDDQILQTQILQTEEIMTIQLISAWHTYQSSLSTYEAHASQKIAAEKYLNDMTRMYKEGKILFIELLDAQTQLFNIKMETNLSLFDTWSKAAEIEYLLRAYPIYSFK